MGKNVHDAPVVSLGYTIGAEAPDGGLINPGPHMAGGVGVTGGPWAAAGTAIFPADAINGAWGDCKSGAGASTDMPDALAVPVAAHGLASPDWGVIRAWLQGRPQPPDPTPDTTPHVHVRPEESPREGAPASEPPGSGVAGAITGASSNSTIRDLHYPLAVSANDNFAFGGWHDRLRGDQDTR